MFIEGDRALIVESYNATLIGLPFLCFACGSPAALGDSMAETTTAPSPRITVVGPVYPHRGGIAHYTACMARALSESGCAVQLISFRRLYPRWLFPGKSQFDPSSRPVEFPSERILSPLNPLTWLVALRAIARFSPDLVVLAWWHSWFFPLTVFMLGWLRWVQRRRAVLLCHNIGSHDHRVADSLAWPILSRLPYGHIVHQSDGPRRILALNAKARVVCSPHPVYETFCDDAVTRDEARRRLNLDPAAEVCLVFGLVRRYKGLDIAIEATGLLRDQRSLLRLIVAGEFYEPRDPYDRMIQRLGLAGRVVVHNRYVPNEEVAAYFRAADLLVAPYRDASHSGVVQIAHGFGLPVVATDVGGMKDLVRDGETGLLVRAVDAKALAEAIGRFFDQGLAADFRRNIVKEKNRFSWSALADTIRILAQRGPG